MKTISVGQAQQELAALLAAKEPLILTDHSYAIALVVHLPDGAPTTTAHNLEVTQLSHSASDEEILSAFRNADAGMHLIFSTAEHRSNVAASDQAEDWWTALQKIQAAQARRGFIGAVGEFRRDDAAYDERLNEIYKNTVPAADEG